MFPVTGSRWYISWALTQVCFLYFIFYCRHFLLQGMVSLTYALTTDAHATIKYRAAVVTPHVTAAANGFLVPCNK
jgi:hypothetical protein